MNGAGNVALRNMRNLMCQHARQFVFATGRFDETCVYADITTGKRKCVDARNH